MTGNGTNYLRRVWKYVKNSKGLINTTDLMVAAGATIILSTGVAGVALSGIDQAKLGKAQPDAQAIASAMSQFFQDTGKWPGQVEMLPTGVGFSATPKFLTTNTTGPLPDFGPLALTTTQVLCSGNSLQGYASGITVPAAGKPTASNQMLDINDFLIRKPDEIKYPNWRGPYLQGEIKNDPFGRIWIVNTLPLFCAEPVGAGFSESGHLGYAWILTGGGNRTITTSLQSARLDDDGDDAGVNVGKLTTKKQQN